MSKLPHTVINYGEQPAQAYPLYWPHGWPRTERRTHSRFEVSRTAALEDLLDALRIMGCREVVISTNVKPDPRSGISNAPEPHDPGVAVYWTRKGQQGCMACDKYPLLRENIRAIGQAIDGLRQVERSGASQVLDRIFTGLKALPAHIVPPRGWRDVLGIEHGAMPVAETIDRLYKELVQTRHPDKGGTHEQFTELTNAREEALREIKWSTER